MAINRRRYHNLLKIHTVIMAQNSSLQSAGRVTGISPKLISSWMKDLPLLLTIQEDAWLHKTLRGKGRRRKVEPFEDILEQWLLNCKEMCRHVNKRNVIEYIRQNFPDFVEKKSNGAMERWVHRFLERFERPRNHDIDLVDN